MVAAEAREFDGILRRCGTSSPLDWPGARFARQASWKGDHWLFLANGPGRGLVEEVLSSKPRQVDIMMSTGYCGALQPGQRVGDIVVSGEMPVSSPIPFVRGEIASLDRVAATATEKRALGLETGAVAVEMEAAAVARKAKEWGVPFCCVRVVSDTAEEDMPLDFNRYRDKEGRFSIARIMLGALARPFTAIPGLMRLDKSCRVAAERLGEFFADSTF